MTLLIEDVERCENCRETLVIHHDDEGVPFCVQCWNNEDLWD